MIEEFKKRVRDAFSKVKEDINNLMISRDSLFDEVGKINGSIDDVSLRVGKVESGVSKLKVVVSEENKSSSSDNLEKISAVKKDVTVLKRGFSSLKSTSSKIDLELSDLKKVVSKLEKKKDSKIDVSAIEASILDKVMSDLDLREKELNKVVLENKDLRETVNTLKSEISEIKREIDNSHLSEELDEIRNGPSREAVLAEDDGINLAIPKSRAAKFETTKKNEASMKFMPEPWSKVSGYKRVKKQNDFW